MFLTVRIILLAELFVHFCFSGYYSYALCDTLVQFYFPYTVIIYFVFYD